MRYIVSLLVVVLVAGCNGGTVDRHALTSDSSTISSINCEAWLVARAAGRGRLTDHYVVEQAAGLQLQAANLADALGERPAAAGLEGRVRAAGREAGMVAARLQRLRDRVGSRAVADELAWRFKAAGHCS